MKTLIVSIVIGMLALAGAAPVAAQLKDDEATSVGAPPHDSAAERNSYTNFAQSEMRMWEKKLHDFNARLDTSATVNKTNAPKSLDSAWTETRTAWDQLVKVGLNAGTDGATVWDSAKVSFQTASQKLAVAWKTSIRKTNR